MKTENLVKLLPARAQARFVSEDPDTYLAEARGMCIFPPTDHTLLELPEWYGLEPSVFLFWVKVMGLYGILGEPKDTNLRNAIALYIKNDVPPEYVRAIRTKRHPVRGAAQIVGCYSYGITAEYAAEADWSFNTDIIWQFQCRGIPAYWMQRLNYMNRQPEWVEVYWAYQMSLDYANALWETNTLEGAQCGHHKIVECWENGVPLAYAEATAPWLAGEDIVRGHREGIPAEFLLAALKPGA